MAVPVSIHILVVDSMHLSLLPMLQSKGYVVDYKPNISPQGVHESIGNYEGIIVRSKLAIDKQLLDKAVRLKFIARAGAGMDQIDIEEAQKRGIHLLNAPEGNRDAVAEHAIAMLLCMLNRIHWADLEVRNKIWNREANRGSELGTKTVGIIGYGNTGQALARKLSGFGCKVLAYDKYRSHYGDSYASQASMEEVFAQSDVLSLHIPLTPETRKMVNSSFLQKFRKNIYLINTARGEIVDLRSVQKALNNGKLIGACLDVLENEKPDKLTEEEEQLFDLLISSEKVLFTPHVAGWTHESYQRINEVLTKKITDLLP